MLVEVGCCLSGCILAVAQGAQATAPCSCPKRCSDAATTQPPSHPSACAELSARSYGDLAGLRGWEGVWLQDRLQGQPACLGCVTLPPARCSSCRCLPAAGAKGPQARADIHSHQRLWPDGPQGAAARLCVGVRGIWRLQVRGWCCGAGTRTKDQRFTHASCKDLSCVLACATYLNIHVEHTSLAPSPGT